LVSYPALLLVGVPPLPASVANQVAGVACWPGSALTSRTELAAVRGHLTRALLIAAVGGAAGAALLIMTSAETFARVVPFLVAAGSLLLVVQPWFTGYLRSRPSRHGSHLVGWMTLSLVSVYGGYFGAGAGILLLGTLLITIDDRLPEANALKNMMLGAGSIVSAAVFVVAGTVVWAATLPLAAGLLVGSALGPIIARRVPATPIRLVVATLGLIFAVQLWLRV
jgi:uncharacterized membrane protein YfcA